MKKVLLSILVLLTVSLSAQANTVKVYNGTSLYFRVHMKGLGDFFIPPGITSYNSVPGNNIMGTRIFYDTEVDGNIEERGFAVNSQYSFWDALPNNMPIGAPLTVTGFHVSWFQQGPDADAKLSLSFY